MFVWVGDDSRKMPNLCASSANKYVRPTHRPWRRCLPRLSPVAVAQSPMPAVSTLMAAASDQSSVPNERAEAFSQHLGAASTLPSHPAPSPPSAMNAACFLCTAKRLPETMVLASYLLPAEPAILHDVAAKKVLQLLEPLIAAQKGAS